MSSSKRSAQFLRSRRDRSRRLLLECLEDRRAPAVFVVSSATADDAPGSLRAAIGAADTNTDADNTIYLSGGTYVLTDSEDGNLLIQDENSGIPQKTLTIIGESEAKAIVQGAATWSDRIFQVVGKNGAGMTAVFQDLVIQQGVAKNGGAVGGTAALGGGLLIDGAKVTLDQVSVLNNQAKGGMGAAGGFSGAGSPGKNAEGGGIYLAGGSLTMVGGTVAGNKATGGAGGKGGIAVGEQGVAGAPAAPGEARAARRALTVAVERRAMAAVAAASAAVWAWAAAWEARGSPARALRAASAA